MLNMANKVFENSAVLSIAIVFVYLLGKLFKKYTPSRLRHGVWVLIAALLLIPTPSIPVIPPVKVPFIITEWMPEQDIDNSKLIYALQASDTFGGYQKPDAPILSVKVSGSGTVKEKLIEAPVVVVETPHKDWKNYLPEILSLLWQAGVLVFIAAFAKQYLSFLKQSRRWSYKAGEREVEALLKAASIYELKRVPEVKTCLLIHTPMLIGIFRPLILLPNEDYSDIELQMIFSHELMHYKRRDILYKVLMTLAVAVNWFNPLVHIMARCMAADAELACDELVVRSFCLDDRKRYGRMLINTAQNPDPLIPFLSTALSSGAKSIKKRLSSVLDTRLHKRWISVCCASVMAVSVLTFSLTSCEGTSSLVPESLGSSGELVLYIPGANGYEGTLLREAIALFRQKYKDVNIISEIVGDMDTYVDSPEYISLVTTEMMAGKGPDVLFTDIFPNIYKVMDANAFVDLKKILENDEEFDFAEYNSVVFDGARYKGHQYVMPVSYYVPVILSSGPAFEKLGFDLSQTKDMPSFMNEIMRCMPEGMNNPMFQQVFEKTGYKYIYEIITASGIRLMDFENYIALPDEDEFRAFCQAMLPFVSFEADKKFQYLFDLAGKSLLRGEYWFESATNTLDFMNESHLLNGDGGFSEDAIRRMDGGLQATIANGVAVRAGSPNQLNAYNFIKILLSRQIQNDYLIVANGYPVRTTSVKTQAATRYEQTSSFTASIYYGGEMWNYKNISTEEFHAHADLVQNVTNCSFPLMESEEQMFSECMDPYFKGEKSLDDCISQLKQKLSLLLSE